MAIIKCKLTGEFGPGVKSHIIPKSFFNLDDPKNPLLLMSSGQNSYPQRSRTGIYDSDLVTAAGEQYFQKPDDYAQKLLIQNQDDFSPLIVENQECGITLSEYDYQTLKTFFLTLLWRAAETKIPSFSRVQLGSHASKIKKMILSGDTGCTEDYSIILFRVPNFPPMKQGTIFFPWRERLSGVNFYKFFLCEYTALIKVDQRRTPQPFNHLQIGPDKPLQIFDKDLRGPEAKALSRIMAYNKSKLPSWFSEAAEV